MRKAVELNEAGIKSPAWAKSKKKPPPPKIPDYFCAALKKNAKAKTLENFSCGNQGESTSIEWLAQDKPVLWNTLVRGNNFLLAKR